MLDDACEALLCENLFPQVGGLVAVWVRRVALPLIVARVKGQEVGRGPGELGRHEHLVGVHCHMDQRPAKLQQRLRGVAVVAILLLPVIPRGLAGPGVLQFNGDQRQAVDEENHVDLFGRIDQ